MNEQMSDIDEKTVFRSRHKYRKEDFREWKHKYEQFKKNLRKQYRHLDDEPSCRLGKMAKKNKARLNFILKPDSDNSEKEEQETNEKNWTKLVPNYMRRIVSKRIKRKIGYRVGINKKITENYYLQNFQPPEEQIWEETLELLEEVAE